MEATSPLPIPRLRLTRHLPQPISDDYLAPPSPNSRSQNDEDEDTDTTPRLSTSAMPDAMSPRATSTSNPPAETPAARLRAVLARIPNNSVTPKASTSRIPVRSPSEPDSDFDPPHSTLATPSFARESLRELFSRALRDSTPRKNRPRRNSIDTSEVDATPRVEQVREKIKSKRRSMSDEEAEKSTVDDSEPSFPTPSAASTYNALRQRLDRSSSVLPSLAPERMMTDMSMPPADSGEETPASPPQGVVMSDANPSHTSATSMRSLQMSTQLQMQSNLLEQDSEMQKALGGMDSSFESDHAPHPRPVAFPSISTKTHTSPARELSWDSHHRSHSIHKLPIAQRPSDDLSSRASSSHSEDKDLHDRERGWNQPGPKSPSHSFSSSSHIGLGKPSGLTLTRRSSGASSHSFEDGRSSQASSLTSRSEIRDRMRELEEERNKEREREWNRNHTLFRSASNLSMESQQERRRTNSQPTRSDSADLYSTPGRLEGISMYRHSSSGSMSSSGRASSAMSSRSMERERDMIMEDEQIHKRERDWSAPRARWQDERRTVSPLPCSSAGSPSHTHRASLKADSPRSSPKGLPDRSKSPSGFGETVNGWGSRDKAALRPMSPLTRSAVETESAGAHPRPRSPLPPQTNSDTGPVDYRSRFGWHFPQHRTPLPPLELEQDTPEKRATPPPRPPSRTSGMIRNSHLPVRSPRSTEKATSPSPSTDRTEHKRRHRRSLTEFTESLGTVPPLIKVESVEPIDITPEDVHHDDLVFASDEDSLPATSTPTTKLEPLPAEDRIPRPPASPPRRTVNQRVQNELAQPDSPPASPPLTPLSPEQTMFSLQTPPRRPHYSTPKAEFKTPSPPRGLPELPEPPSSSEDDTGRNDRTPMALRYNQPGDMTAMKTPRPPGAWLTTPAPRHVVKKSPERTSSAPQPSGDTSKSDSSGLPTPPSTWTRASSIPPQTPAPPGAWLGTPASTRPRSILKVRFEDIESETSEAVSDHPPVLAAKQQPVDVKREHRREAAPEALRSLPKLNLLSESPQEDSSLDRPSTPPSLRARLRQRSPGVRIVDAFGRVTIEKEEDVEHVEPPKREELEEQPKPFKPAPRETRATPRNRSIVKIVDAMGREIEEPDESTSEASFHLSHNEALARVRNTIADMAEDLSEADRSSDHLALDENRCAALDDASKAARRARNKISRSLQLVKNTESDLRSRYGSLRESMRKSKFLPTESVERQPTWSFLNRWVLGCFVIVQIILFLIMYRMSAIRAKHIFLTTYYDSFNPDLYLYVTRPDTINHSIPSSGWSIFSIPATIQRVGWTGVVAELWGNATGAFYHWQRRTWDVWGANAGGQTALSWPPT